MEREARLAAGPGSGAALPPELRAAGAAGAAGAAAGRSERVLRGAPGADRGRSLSTFLFRRQQ